MKLEELPTDRRVTRRLVTIPLWFLLATVLPFLALALLPVALMYDLVAGKKFSATRTLIFFPYFFVLESVGLVISFVIWLRGAVTRPDKATYELWNRKLQRWWSRGLFWGSCKVFSVDVKIHNLELLEDERPAVVLVRHASTLDTMIPLAIVRQLKLYRYVIKAELLTDPALDVVGQRFPNVFVKRGSRDPGQEIKKVLALADKLESENSAVVVYPEGTRFTAKKRQRLLEKFNPDDPIFPIAERLTHTLPPLREGALKLLEVTPELDVVFLSHRGLESATAMSTLIRGGLTHQKLDIDIWRFQADLVPRHEDALRDFLLENWERIDQHVGGFEKSPCQDQLSV